jgi:hypothetical protein
LRCIPSYSQRPSPASCCYACCQTTLTCATPVPSSSGVSTWSARNGSCLAWWLPYPAIGPPSRSPTPLREWVQARMTAGSPPAGKRPGLCLGHVAAGWCEQHSKALRSRGPRDPSPALAAWLLCDHPRSVAPRAPTHSYPHLPTPVQGLSCRRPIDPCPPAGQKV